MHHRSERHGLARAITCQDWNGYITFHLQYLRHSPPLLQFISSKIAALMHQGDVLISLHE